MRIMSELAKHGVGLHCGASDIIIGKDFVSFQCPGEQVTVPGANVIVAKGAEGDLSLADSLRAAGFEVRAVGDANGVGYIEGGVRGAADAVRELAGA